jgi:hypothetical protein
VPAEQDGESIRFSVRDEGLGIPIGEQDRIFEKFYRLDPDNPHVVGGSGLGLYICRELVHSMNGRSGSSPRQHWERRSSSSCRSPSRSSRRCSRGPASWWAAPRRCIRSGSADFGTRRPADPYLEPCHLRPVRRPVEDPDRVAVRPEGDKSPHVWQELWGFEGGCRGGRPEQLL